MDICERTVFVWEMNGSNHCFFLLLCLSLSYEAQLSAVDAWIDSMSLVQKDEEEGTIEDLFPTSKIPNPQFQRLFQVREER